MKSWRVAENGRQGAASHAAVHSPGLRIVGFCPFDSAHFSHQIPLNPTRSDRIPPTPSGRPSANSTQFDLIRPNSTKINNVFSILGKIAPRRSFRETCDSPLGLGVWSLEFLSSLDLGRLELCFPLRRSSRKLCDCARWTASKLISHSRPYLPLSALNE